MEFTREDQQYAWNLRLLLEGNRPDGSSAPKVKNIELAKALGINHQTIGIWKNCKRQVPEEMKQRIEEYFKVPVEEMYVDWFAKAADNKPSISGIYTGVKNGKPENQNGTVAVMNQKQFAIVSDGSFGIAKGSLIIVDPVAVPGSVCIAGNGKGIFVGRFVNSSPDAITLDDERGHVSEFKRKNVAGRCVEIRYKIK